MANYTSFLSVVLLLLICCPLTILSARDRGFQVAPLDENTCPVATEQCGSECERRCSQTHHQGNCLDECNLCCNECQCVPPGFYGNKECCSCYQDKQTQEGTPKCP